MRNKILLLLVFQLFVLSLFAQSKADMALAKGKEALQMRESGDFEKAISLLEEASKLDNENINYPYELAYANYLSKNYKKSIKILEDLKKHKDVYDKVYQLLGNAYESNGQRDKSIDTYLKGLKLYPSSGHLFLEMGVVNLRENEEDKALIYFENGIKNAPEFASNYYWASKIYCNSSEEAWGLLYGEIFLNLENNTVRTEEISKLIYDTYKREINFVSDKEISANFVKEAAVEAKNTSLGSSSLPFDIGVYQPLMLLSLTGEKQISISSLDRTRARFLDGYFKKGFGKSYSNVLFDYLLKVKEAGHLEAYNYWILMHGNEKEFSNWKSLNKDRFVNFLKWFSKNPVVINENNRFYKDKY